MPDLVLQLGTALRQQAMPFLSRVESLLGFIEEAKSFSYGNPHTPNSIAFALARAGHTAQAVDVFRQLLNQVDLNVAWQREIADQAKALQAKLAANPAEAQEQLEAWETETIRNLGLESFR
jgi:cytochrome c-type biogenesis protein CcmH/NrfG